MSEIAKNRKNMGMRTKMKLSAFRIEIAESLIAPYPVENRDESRLMVVHKESGKIEHKIFKDVVDYYQEGDTLVVNDTMVFPAVLCGNKEKTGADIEVFLLRELNPKTHLWDVLVDPARKIRVGNKLYFGEGELMAEVIDNTTSRGRTIRFLFDGDDDDFYKTIDTLGKMPIPKDFKRGVEPIDRERFQTIFAKEKGAVVVPSAGLHFTTQIVKKLELKGVNIVPITLHIGLGSFRDVEVEDLTKHKMESENFAVSKETAATVNKTLLNKRNVCAVGTTSMKALETSVSASEMVKENAGWTDKFIFPPYEFKICKSLITGFHKPKSTLLMTGSAFAGYELMMEVYEVAQKEKYRFLSYGDAVLIL